MQHFILVLAILLLTSIVGSPHGTLTPLPTVEHVKETALTGISFEWQK